MHAVFVEQMPILHTPELHPLFPVHVMTLPVAGLQSPHERPTVEQPVLQNESPGVPLAVSRNFASENTMSP